MSAAAEFRKKLEAYAAKHAINDIESRVRTAVTAGNADKANRLRNESTGLMKRWEAGRATRETLVRAASFRT